MCPDRLIGVDKAVVRLKSPQAKSFISRKITGSPKGATKARDIIGRLPIKDAAFALQKAASQQYTWEIKPAFVL